MIYRGYQIMHSVDAEGWCIETSMPLSQPTAMFPLPDMYLGLMQHNGFAMLWGITRVHWAVRAGLWPFTGKDWQCSPVNL